MSSMFQPFLLSFVALFVAIDCVAVIPLYLNLTQDLTDHRRSKLLYKALLTAGAVAFLFLVMGKFVFSIFGITESDFKVGGNRPPHDFGR